MLSVERETLILQKLKHEGKVMVNTLAEELQVTTMTIRRDLHKLEQQGLLQKVHGGAVLPAEPGKERPFEEKQGLYTEEKRQIAQAALSLVQPGDTILLDAGTTTFALASLLPTKSGVNVVTSDLHIATQLCATEGKLFFIGGEIEKELARSKGAKAFQFLEELHVDTVFLGISAISDDFMLGSHTFDNAELKRTMLKCGTRKVLLADSSKFGLNAFAKVSPLSALDRLITDKTFNDRELTWLETNKVELFQVESPC